jgi:hypothetical protein
MGRTEKVAACSRLITSPYNSSSYFRARTMSSLDIGLANVAERTSRCSLCRAASWLWFSSVKRAMVDAESRESRLHSDVDHYLVLPSGDAAVLACATAKDDDGTEAFGFSCLGFLCSRLPLF